MAAVMVGLVGYAEAARRHFKDANILMASTRQANAGQLYGIAAECGVKAILVGCGIPTLPDGTISKPPGVAGKAFREHLPFLSENVVQLGHLPPVGRMVSSYSALMPSLAAFSNWLVEHRYWQDSSLPLASLPNWQSAAGEVMLALDKAKEDGVL